MKKIFSLTLLAIFFLAGSGYSAVVHTDGDIYGDTYSVEDRNGNWQISGTMTGKRNVTVITTPANTAGTVTVAKSGYVFVLKPAGVAVGGVGYSLTLPAVTTTTNSTFSGERYTFSTATGSTLSVLTGDSTIYYGANNSTRITSPAATGSSVTVVGSGTSWYVESMSGAWVAGTA